MTVVDNKTIIRRFYEEGINARNLDVIRELVTPDFVGHYPEVMAGLSETSHGAQALVQDLNFIGAMIPDFRTTIEDLVGSGDRVAVRGSTSGNHTGQIPGAPPTNRAVAFTWCAIYRFTDGKIVERWMNDDALSTFQQVGLVPSLPPPSA